MRSCPTSGAGTRDEPLRTSARGATSEADAPVKYGNTLVVRVSPLSTPWKMTTVREGYLRNLPHPNLNDALKSNTDSAIKLLKTGRTL